MAKSINKATLFLNLVLMFSLLLTINMAESKHLFGIGFGKGKSAPVCNQVFAQRDGDTCFSISKMFNLTPEFFSAINPNLNCDKIFIGEWLCVDGAVS